MSRGNLSASSVLCNKSCFISFVKPVVSPLLIKFSLTHVSSGTDYLLKLGWSMVARRRLKAGNNNMNKL